MMTPITIQSVLVADFAFMGPAAADLRRKASDVMAASTAARFSICCALVGSAMERARRLITERKALASAITSKRERCRQSSR